MAKQQPQPTGHETPFHEDEIIVSKTDLKGRITYFNDVFLRVAGYPPDDAARRAAQHHPPPDMPRCVFKLLWDTIQAKGEIFTYVVNLATNGDHCWVFAHITPSFDASGEVVGYHSNRRKPDADEVAKIEPIYRSLLDAERGVENRKEGMQVAHEQLFATLATQGVAYDEFVLSL